MGHKKLVFSDPSEEYPEYLRINKTANPALNFDDAKPLLFDLSKKSGESDLQRLLSDKSSSIEIIDNYAEQYAELLLSKHAHLYRANYEVQVESIKSLLEEHYNGRQAWTLGAWVYFPWKKQLVHVLGQDDFETLRTIRNRDLITAEEQGKLFKFSAICFGMSVGSTGALGLTISGMSRNIKLIDGAVISGSNLNRILTGVSSVGKGKALVIGQQIYEMNPYSSVGYFDKVEASNIDSIFDDSWSTDIAIDEIDDIEMKVRIRSEARKRKVPVIMATELGDTVMLDVERFDLEPSRPLFHGAIPEIEQLLDRPVENYREWTKHAVNMIDPTNMSLKLQKSLLKIGTTIVTHPQLGSTVMMTGGVLAFAAKSIALGQPLQSGRYVISLENEFLADHKSRKYSREHKKHTKMLRRTVNSM